MTRRALETNTLWVDEGGAGEPTLLLLHGLGATGEVWRGLASILEARWPGRWLIPDLCGHGRSGHASSYALGLHAADMATLVGAAGPVTVVGHSMGGAVGLALASGWFGVPVSSVVAVGVKVSWTDADIRQVQELARRPVRWFDNRAEAVERFLRVSGLYGLISPDSAEAASGIVEVDGRYRLAADPATVLVVAPPMADLMAAAQARVRLACGSEDQMVSIEELRRYDPGAVALQGLGHNAHVQDPGRIWQLIQAVTGLRVQ